jgi:hypothetical protein
MEAIVDFVFAAVIILGTLGLIVAAVRQNIEDARMDERWARIAAGTESLKKNMKARGLY